METLNPSGTETHWSVNLKAVMLFQSSVNCDQDWSVTTVFTPELFRVLLFSFSMLFVWADVKPNPLDEAVSVRFPNELQSSLDPLRSDLCLTKLPGVQCTFEPNAFHVLWFLGYDRACSGFPWNTAEVNMSIRCKSFMLCTQHLHTVFILGDLPDSSDQ